jgi:Mrp family chromosome partitioning ATPase
MSIGFLAGRDEAVVWRGPKKTGMIQKFLTDVVWGELDYLVIDTPPGTSDEHMTVVECLRTVHLDGAVLVTTPQGVALADVRREATFCVKMKVPILGVVENMSGFVCPHCAECTNLFATGGGERLAAEIQCPFLGRIPIDPQLGQLVGEGQNYLEAFEGSGTFTAVMNIVQPLVQLERRA